MRGGPRHKRLSGHEAVCKEEGEIVVRIAEDPLPEPHQGSAVFRHRIGDLRGAHRFSEAAYRSYIIAGR